MTERISDAVAGPTPRSGFASISRLAFGKESPMDASDEYAELVAVRTMEAGFERIIPISVGLRTPCFLLGHELQVCPIESRNGEWKKPRATKITYNFQSINRISSSFSRNAPSTFFDFLAFFRGISVCSASTATTPILSLSTAGNVSYR